MRYLMTTCALVVLSLTPEMAAAQDTEESQSDASAPGDQVANSGDSGEIVVTALRRDSTLRETPLSIAAMSGDNLRALSATGLSDYFRTIPNLNLTEGVSGQGRVNVRGVVSAGEATTGLYYDETPLAGPSGTGQDASSNPSDLNLFDVERVEVLRGPQGTLYGASSMAGTLRIILNKPVSTEYQAAAEAQVSSIDGGSEGYFAKGMVNVPIAKDVLAVRVAGYYEKRGGYVDNIRLGLNDVNQGYSQGVRALIGFTPTENLKIVGTYIHQYTHVDDSQGWLESLGDYKTNMEARTPYTTKLDLYNLTGSLVLPGITLTATGSYYRYGYVRTFDFSAIHRASLTSTCPSYFQQATACSSSQLTTYQAFAETQFPEVAYQPADAKSKTAEFRIASNTDSPLQYTAGTFYENRHDYIDAYNVLADETTGEIKQPLEPIYHRYVDTRLKQLAVFGDVAYTLSDFTLSLGARYFDYERVTASETDLASPINGSSLRPYRQDSSKAADWIQKINFSYKPSSRLMIYASASKGFRPGGANNIVGLPDQYIIYGPDSLWNYEVGYKSAWLGNKIQLNAAAFWIDWQDMQTSVRASGTTSSFIANVGRARVQGLEADLTVKPVKGLTLTAAAGYSRARLREDQAGDGTPYLGSGTTGLKGDRLPDTPDFTASSSATYAWPLSSGLDGSVRLDYTYTGVMQTTFHQANDPAFERYGGYSTLGFRAGIDADNYSVALFATNLTNSQGEVGVQTYVLSASVIPIKRYLFTVRPRTIGVNTRVSF